MKDQASIPELEQEEPAFQCVQENQHNLQVQIHLQPKEPLTIHQPQSCTVRKQFSHQNNFRGGNFNPTRGVFVCLQCRKSFYLKDTIVL